MPPAYEVLLLNTAVPQIQAAQSGDTYVVPRDIAFSAALTLSAGTANGVPYLDGSKVLTTGSGLTFDGTTLTVNANIFLGTTQRYIYQTGTANLNFQTNTGDVVWLRNNGSSEAMRLDSTGLGIGTSSPGYKLDVITPDTNGFAGARIRNNDVGSSAYAGLILNASGNSWSVRMGSTAANSNALQFVVDQLGSPSVKATLDSSGNLGLGVTPSAWGGTFVAYQVKNGYLSGYSNRVYVGANNYYDGSNNIYIASDYATRYYQNTGQHIWETSASGTANTTTITNGVSYTIITSGNQTDFGAANNNVGTVFTATSSGTLSSGTVSQNISFTQALTLTAAGDLLVGITSSSHRLHAEVASGADRDILMASVAGATNGFRVQWDNSSSKIHVSIANIPTSSAGLPAGTLWNDGGTLKIA